MNYSELLKKLCDGEMDPESVIPNLVILKLEDDGVIPEDAKFTTRLARKIVEDLESGYNMPLLCKYEGGQIDLL